MRQRPLGVKIFGVVFLLYGFAIIQIFYLLAAMRAGWKAPISETVLRLLMNGEIVLGLAYVVAGVSLLMLKSWARKLVLILTLMSLVYRVVFEICTGGRGLLDPSTPSETVTRLVAALGWSGLLLWYFLRPSVKAQFTQATSSK